MTGPRIIVPMNCVRVSIEQTIKGYNAGRSGDMTRMATLFVACIGLAFAAQAAAAAPQFLRTKADLGDPRGYCLDVPGFGDSLDLQAPVQTHSCKYDRPGFYVDELLSLTEDGHLRFTEYDRCLKPQSLEAGAKIGTADCEDGDAQAWTRHKGGRITPASDPGLCLTVTPDRAFAGTDVMTLPAYSTRAVSLQHCAADAHHRQAWRWSDPHEKKTYNANTLRNDIPADVQEQLREKGRSIDPAATAKIYDGMSRQFGPADVTVDGPISYGPNKRHRLEVVTGKNRHAAGAAPVIVLVHGGGFVGGDLDGLHHAATHFAGLGFVAVNITYPLAPDHKWPAGAEAVARALNWVSNNIADYNGNPDDIVLIGHSAGAAHVADFVFRPDILPDGMPTIDAIDGAILASPPVQVDPENPGKLNAAYYGTDAEAIRDKVLFGNIARTTIPVLITTAELDPVFIHRSAAELLHRLTNDHGAIPRLRQIPGHGHISYISAIGTGDRLFLEEALDFIAVTTGE